MYNVDNNTIRNFLNSNIRDDINITVSNTINGSKHIRLQLNFNVEFEIPEFSINNSDMHKVGTEHAEYKLIRTLHEITSTTLPKPMVTTLYGMDVIISPYCPDGVMLMHPSHYVSEQSRYFNQMIPCPEPPIITNKSNCRW